MVCSRCPREYLYYESALKRKCFKKLKRNVWETKTKWILLKKADYHYRMKLLYKYINLWMVYLNECYKKKINYQTAVDFYEGKLKARGILILKRNVEEILILCRIFSSKFEWKIKYRCWHQWMHYVQKRLKVKEVKLLANKIREERLKIRFFYLWLFRFKEKRSLQDASKAAILRLEIKIKGKYFKFWKIFTEKQICKMKIKKLALTCYQDRLKEKYIGIWKKYTLQKKYFKYQVVNIKNSHDNYLLQSYISQWCTAYRTLKLKKKNYKNSLALNFYDRKLLEKSFKILEKSCQIKRERRDKIIKFRNIYINSYLNYYLNAWMEKRREKIVWNLLENKAARWRESYLQKLFLTSLARKHQEQKEEKEEIANAVRYSNAIVMHRAFQGWWEVRNRRTYKKTRLENATKFYFEKLLQKSIEKWRIFALARSRKKMAIEYCSSRLLSGALRQWKLFLRERKLKIAKANSLEQMHILRLKNKAFNSWKNEMLVYKTKLNAAIVFNEKLKLTKVFYVWKETTRLKAVNKNRFNRIKAVLNDIRMKDTIFRWYEIHSVKQNMKAELEEFKRRCEKRCSASYFCAWRGFVEKKKRVQGNAHAFPQLRSNVLLEQYLVILLEAVSVKKVLKEKEELAKRFEKDLLKRKHLRKWMSFSRWKKKKILFCMSDERKFIPKDIFDGFTPAGNSARRKPMIPGYLRSDLVVERCEDEESGNQETYRIGQPVNSKLPVIGRNEDHKFFEI